MFERVSPPQRSKGCPLRSAAALLVAGLVCLPVPAQAAAGTCTPPARLATLVAVALERPHSADAQFELALAYARTPFPERAWEALERLQALDPRYGRRLVEHYGPVVASRPADLEARFRLAAGCWLLGRRGEARQHLQAIVAASPREAWALVYLGWVLAEARQNERAVSLWQQAVAVEPENAVAHWLLGQALQRKGQRGRAATALRTALSLRAGYEALTPSAP